MPAGVEVVDADAEVDIVSSTALRRLPPARRSKAVVVDFQTGRAGQNDVLLSLSLPWGANAEECQLADVPREEIVLLVGDDEAFASHGQVLFASVHANLPVRHLGRIDLCQCTGPMRSDLLCTPLAQLAHRRPCDWYRRLPPQDHDARFEMRRARFVSALGADAAVVAVTALFCGARPIIADSDPKTAWYRKHSLLTSDSARRFDELQAHFTGSSGDITDAEARTIRTSFSWQSQVPDLIKRVRYALD